MRSPSDHAFMPTECGRLAKAVSTVGIFEIILTHQLVQGLASPKSTVDMVQKAQVHHMGLQ